MATFIFEALISTDDEPRALPDVNVFFDDGGTHEGSINSLGILGIVRGTGANQNGDPIYRPDLDVERDQMASFLARTLDLMVEEGTVVPPPTS